MATMNTYATTGQVQAGLESDKTIVRTSSGVPVILGNENGLNNVSIWVGNQAQPTSFTRYDLPTGSFSVYPAISGSVTFGIRSDDVCVIVGTMIDGMQNRLCSIEFDVPNTTWQNAQTVTTVGATSIKPTIAIDSNDRCHVAWVYETTVMGTVYPCVFYTNDVATQGSWITPVNAYVDADVSYWAGTGVRSDIVVSDENIPEIITVVTNEATANPDVKIVALQGNQNNASSFSSFNLYSYDLGANDPQYVRITVNADGDTLVFYKKSNGDIVARRINDAASWTVSLNWTAETVIETGGSGTLLYSIGQNGNEIRVSFLVNNKVKKIDDSGTSLSATDVTSSEGWSSFVPVSFIRQTYSYRDISGTDRTYLGNHDSVTGVVDSGNNLTIYEYEFSSSVTLVVQEASHTHTADNTALTQKNTLAVQEASHTHTSDSPSLIQHFTLTVQDASHAHTADTPTPVLSTTLSNVNDSIHSQTADSVDLLQAHVLALEDSLHNHLADGNLSLQQNFTLSVAEASHVHTAENITLNVSVNIPNVNDTSHTHTSDNVQLTQKNTLAVNDTAHTHTSDGVALTQKSTLSIQEASHVHTSDNVVLSQSSTLASNDSSHLHTADNVVLSVSITLTVQGSSHGHTVDNAILTQKNTLVTSDSSHGHTADGVSLSQGFTLVIQDASHIHTADGVVLSQSNVLVVDETQHTHTADNVVLFQGLSLVVADSSHQHTADGVVLSQKNVLSVQDSSHQHTADNVSLNQWIELTVQETSHSHTADNVSLSASLTLVVSDSSHAHTSENTVLSQKFTLSIADSSHSHTSDNVVLNFGIVLVVADSSHSHTADGVSVVQSNTLVVADSSHLHFSNDGLLITLELPSDRNAFIDMSNITEALFLNGKQVDIIPNTLTLNFQVNDLGELKDRQSDYSNRFKLPLTANNIEVMENLGIPGDVSPAPYQNIPAKYVIEGVELIPKGFAVVNEIQEDDEVRFYDCVIYSNNIDFFKAIEGKSIRDLNWSDIDHHLTYNKVIESFSGSLDYIYAIAGYAGRIPVQNNFNLKYMLPSVWLHVIFDRIFTEAGFTYEGDIFTDPEFTSMIVGASSFDTNQTDLLQKQFSKILPDIDQKQFIKEVLWMFGLMFKKDRNDNHYVFKQMKDVLKDKANAVDYSDKLSYFKSTSFRLGQYAKNNWIRYAESDNGSTDQDGSITVNIENLSGSKDLMKSVFMARTTNTVFKYVDCQIFEIDSENNDLKINTEKAWIARVNFLADSENFIDENGAFQSYPGSKPFAQFIDLSFRRMIYFNYREIREVIEKARVMNIGLKLNPIDVYHFDFLKPIYLEQFGAYFYVNRLKNYRSDRVTEAEVVKIPVEVFELEADTTNPVVDLQIDASPVTQGHVSTFTLNVTEENIDTWTLEFGYASLQVSGFGQPPLNIIHQYPVGSYTATLTVVDWEGNQGSDTAGITVNAVDNVQIDPGTGEITAPAGETITFKLSIAGAGELTGNAGVSPTQGGGNTLASGQVDNVAGGSWESTYESTFVMPGNGSAWLTGSCSPTGSGSSGGALVITIKLGTEEETVIVNLNNTFP